LQLFNFDLTYKGLCVRPIKAEIILISNLLKSEDLIATIDFKVEIDFFDVASKKKFLKSAFYGEVLLELEGKEKDIPTFIECYDEHYKYIYSFFEQYGSLPLCDALVEAINSYPKDNGTIGVIYMLEDNKVYK